jgi:prepilin peptidase CpaA
VGQLVSLPLAVVLVTAVVAAMTDLWQFRIHNVLTLPLLLSGVVYHGVTGGLPGLLESLGGVCFGFGILFLFYIMGGMGGGDVKLMAGVGAWLGMPLTLYVFLASSLAAGLYAVVIIFAYGSARETLVNLQIIWYRLAAVGRHLGGEDRVEVEVKRADRRKRVIPFAAMMALGILALITLAWLNAANAAP